MSKKLTIVFLLIIGAIAVVFWVSKSSSSSSSSSSSEFPLINKAIVANIGKHFIINFGPLKRSFLEIQKKYPQKTYVYFSYINNGSWIGLNEKEKFTAASTLKVPLAMSLFKAVEEGKLKLSDSYSLRELDLNDGFGDLYKVGEDQEFTVEELSKIMLEKSDNTAMNALFAALNRIGINSPLERIYESLGWEFALTYTPSVDEKPDYSKINLKTLSNLFIALYNATYVSAENSNKILTYLTNTPFNNKIAAGVPDGVTVSHKIGVSTGDDTYSDCGIIYASNRNYILCIGSTGVDEESANRFMAEISKATYEYVINN